MNPFLALIQEIKDWIDAILACLPGRIGVRLRGIWFRLRLAKSGRRLSIERGSRISFPERMEIADDVAIGENCRLSAGSGKLSIDDRTKMNAGVSLNADFGEIVIGKDVLIAMNVVARSSNHRFDRSPGIPINRQGHQSSSIVIGDDVWIGANAVLLPGAKIGDHCVIGASAVVSTEIPPCSVAVGVPARVIRTLG